MADRERLKPSDIAVLFRALADQHARKRAAAERSRTWQLIRSRVDADRKAHWHTAPTRWLVRVAVPVAAAAAIALGIVVLRARAELRYEVRGAALVDGAIRTEARNAVIDFSDGSRIEMSKGSTSHIEIAGDHAARARLTAGDMEVSVHHARDTDYRFLAGPYEVRVVGTKFHLSWEPRSGSFAVQMREGRVRVLGPDALDRALAAGETLRLSSAEPAIAKEASAPEASPRTGALGTEHDAPAHSKPGAQRNALASADSAAIAQGAARTSVLGESERPPAALPKPDPDAWPTLVAKGNFAEVVSAARSIGTERALRERSSADLSALAHAASYTGQGALALSAWAAVRERFLGQDAGRKAAFFLGRICDQQGRSAEALRWLNLYLAEGPRDVYASEALGRKLSVVQKLQGKAPARAVAEDYLARFPSGAYAPSARALLGN